MEVHNPNGLPTIDYKNLVKLQPDSFKSMTDVNRAKLINSLNEFGFFIPMFVWSNKGVNYTIDGHQRMDVLGDMYPDGIEIPYLKIDAKNKKDAAKKLLAIDGKFGKREVGSEAYFMELFDIDNFYVMENVVLDFDLLEGYDLGDELTDNFSLKSGDKDPFQQMTFTLADEQAVIIQNAISDIKGADEYKYAETMGNENSNGNALYLIVSTWAGQRK